MSNLTAQPPPQLSKDGRWRWDGNKWVLLKPRSSVPSYLPGPSAPQLSSDGRWWWTDYRWVPADPASSKPPKPPGPGALAKWAIASGLFALVTLLPALVALMQPPPGTTYGWGDVPFVLAVPLTGAVLGVLALVFPGHGHVRAKRRRLAWGGIAASLTSAAAVLGVLALAS